MLVKEVIRRLKAYNPEDNIFIRWWDIDMFADVAVTEAEWNETVDTIDDWGFEDLNQEIREILEFQIRSIQCKEAKDEC
ncbi:MAG: hypothetical protein H8D23_21650 [Candidatus Brocadiales bacterium]|nr:hypothetical protein [Candidatus Brocadiales bacterium]